MRDWERSAGGGVDGVAASAHGQLGVGKRTLIDTTFGPATSTGGPLQMKAAQSHETTRDEHVHAAAARGLEGPAGQLPHLETIQRSFGCHDVAGISAHVGGPATAATQAMGAEAYATGNHVAFAGTPSLHTAAHEAAHVVQQRAGVQLKGGVGAPGDPHERHADEVADRVVVGDSAEALLDTYAVGSTSRTTGGVQRKPDQGPAAAPAANAPATDANGGPATHLIQLLTSTSPGVASDPAGYLNTLDMPSLLAAIDGALDAGYAPQLHARLGSARPFLVAALYAVELARSMPLAPNHPLLQRAGVALDQISRDQQLQILDYLLHRRGVTVEAATLVEGVLAMREGATADTAAASQQRLPTGAGRGAGDLAGSPDSAHPSADAAGAAIGASIGAAAPAPISPGPWAPPGNQPGGLYVGTEAHYGIARAYVAAHPGDRVTTNTLPISNILGALASMGRRGNATDLDDTDLAARPDIANLTRMHLYEIKPLAAQAEAAAKARMYLSIFERAGIAMTLGPTGEPGTTGGLPGPAGVFMFESPEPGVITYQYRRGRLVPVPVAQPEAATERRWRWELQPLTPAQQQAIVTTTVGGAILIMLMILFSPVGA